MHTLIHILVEATDRESALEAGEDALEVLIGDMEEPAVFDDFRMFSVNQGREDAVEEWGDLPPAVPVDSSDGEELLDRGWAATKRDFEQNLATVRESLESLTDEEIMNDRNDIRLAFYQLGVLEGPPIHLYDKLGYGIRSRDRLDKVLEQYDETWIVPADAVR